MIMSLYYYCNGNQIQWYLDIESDFLSILLCNGSMV